LAALVLTAPGWPEKTKALPSAVVQAGSVGARTISLQEVDARAMATSHKPFRALYDARRQAFDEIVADWLLLKEAKRRGSSVEELKRQVVSGRAPATEADAELWFNLNRDQVGKTSFADTKGSVLKQLNAESEAAALSAFVASLKKATEVHLVLEPPRLAVRTSETDPSQGPVGAPVEIVEFFDYQCPFCAKVSPTLAKIREVYGDRVRVVVRDYALAAHPNARIAAEAADCARRQGKFWPYHERLFANAGKLDANVLRQIAADTRLDLETFDGCVTQHLGAVEVDRDIAEGTRLGVHGTPTCLINGRFQPGALSFEAMSALIDEELERMKSAGAAAATR